MRFSRIALGAFLSLALCTGAVNVRAEVGEVRLAAQFGLAYLPLIAMERLKLIERHAQAAGLGNIKVTWAKFAGANVMNDALLSGNLEFSSLGPTPLGIMWARTRNTPNEVKGVAAYCTFPLYLNTRNPNVKTIRDFTEKDRIAVPAVKVSGQALTLQMAAAHIWGQENYAKLDSLTIAQSHPDASAQLLSGKSVINAHFTAAPFHQMQMKDPVIRTVLKSYDVVGGPATAIILATTAQFRNGNPKTYRAVLAALEDAIAILNNDKKAAAELYLKATPSEKSTPAEILKMIEDPDFIYTTTPHRVYKYVEFMEKVGVVKVKPDSWKDMFFPEIHNLPGS
ncbi:MAG: ABC transporter substrate-binding protein [Burkholderiales bacterium]|nr:ABC transporter substrate-binding protein [Burkholderiales bacterium]